MKPLKAVIVSCLLHFIYHGVQKSLGFIKTEVEKAPLDMGMVMGDSRDLLLKQK